MASSGAELDRRLLLVMARHVVMSSSKSLTADRFLQREIFNKLDIQWQYQDITSMHRVAAVVALFFLAEDRRGALS